MSSDDLAGQFKHWSPAAQEKARELLSAAQDSPWRPFYCEQENCDGNPHDRWTFPHARADQHPPRGNSWLLWLLMGGRGAGKTRAGSEWSHRMAKRYPRGALIAATGADARDIMLEGESGLLKVAHPQFRPVYEPSKRRLTWPNGAMAIVFSAEEPDRLRGPNHFWAWCDEPAHWPLVQDAWDMLLFGLRLGPRPRVCATTTPRPTRWMRERLAESATVLSRASTYDNLTNLSPAFADAILARYEGTRLGRQEIHAEILSDVEGALWTWELIERARVLTAPTLERIVVGIDPAGSSGKDADETGLIVVGAAGAELYVLADESGRYTPYGWASKANELYERYSADAIVAEKNFGGEMVKHTLESSGYTGARLLMRHTRRSKALRAEPIVGRYEKDEGHVHHVGPLLSELETQMTEWVPWEGDSPDRVDALVYACTELLKNAAPASVASPVNLRLVQGGAA